jgi:hypothetical protein
MLCVLSKCQCNATEYFDSSVLACVNKKVNNEACTSSHNCRSDLGLSCQSNLCQCDLGQQFWLPSASMCVSLLNYTQTGCSADSHCIGSLNLICNTNPVNNPCSCPTTSISSMCDCRRIFGSEFYWHGTSCVPAKTFGDTCSSLSYQCQTKTQGTLCISSICNCTRTSGNESYFNGSYCVPALAYNSACSYSATCQVLTQLTQCIAGKCTCERVANSEFYWDGTKCLAAKVYGAS